MHILYVCVHVHSCVCIHEYSFLICQFPNLKVGALILCIKCPVFLSTGADEMVSSDKDTCCQACHWPEEDKYNDPLASMCVLCVHTRPKQNVQKPKG